jgi:hypothetical protein
MMPATTVPTNAMTGVVFDAADPTVVAGWLAEDGHAELDAQAEVGVAIGVLHEEPIDNEYIIQNP